MYSGRNTQDDHKEYYTFKTIQKTISAYLERHTHTSRYKNLQSFASNDQGDCCFTPALDTSSFEKATPQQRSWCILLLAKEESVTALQRTFRTQFQRYCAWYKKFEQ